MLKLLSHFPKFRGCRFSASNFSTKSQTNEPILPKERKYQALVDKWGPLVICTEDEIEYMAKDYEARGEDFPNSVEEVGMALHRMRIKQISELSSDAFWDYEHMKKAWRGE